MKRQSFRFLSLSTLLLVLLTIITSQAFAQEEVAEGAVETPAVQATVATPDAPPVRADVEEASPERPVFHRRLPNYYSRVVDRNQREAIYGIQEEYFDQIAQLRARIVALEEERNGKIEEMLTPEQLAAVQQMEEAARLEREQKAEQRRAEAETE